MTRPVVYTKPACPQCVATHRHLTRKGIPFDTINLPDDPEALAFVRGLGHLSAPVVYVNPDLHWSGYRPTMIDAL